MLQLKQKPYNLLLLAAALLMLLSFSNIRHNRTIDIHLRDTYFVIGQSYIIWFFAFVTWMVWILYHFLNQLLYSKKLTWIHVIATLITVVLFLLLLLLPDDSWMTFQGRSASYASWQNFEHHNRLIIIKTLLLLSLLLLGQFCLLINLVLGLSRFLFGVSKLTP